MTDTPVPENSLAEDLQFHPALAHMSETDLARFLDMVRTLDEDFRLLLLHTGESVEAVAAAQHLVKTWKDEADGILTDKQTTDTHKQLHNWDNEGGMVDPPASRRVVIRTEQGKRRVAWADVEE